MYYPEVSNVTIVLIGKDTVTNPVSFDLTSPFPTTIYHDVSEFFFLLNGSTDKEALNDTFDLEAVMGPRMEALETAVTMTMVYALLLITGAVGNICTCVVIARNRYMHTATNYYLFSLAISDLLLLLFGLPQDLCHLWERYPYIFGEVFCVLRGWVSETSTNASILTITAFTIERYLAICHPLRAHTMSRLSRAIKFIVVIWICGGLSAIPIAYQLGITYEHYDSGITVPETSRCDIKRHLEHSFETATFVFFILPASLLSGLYVLIALQLRRSSIGTRQRDSKKNADHANGTKGQGKSLNALTRQASNTQKNSSRKAVVKMLVAVVVAFFLCWAPFHAQRLMAVYVTEPTEVDFRTFSALTNISGITYYVSATINPILYSILSLKFRHAFRDTLSRCLGRRNGTRDRVRTAGRFTSTLRSAGYEFTDFTVVSESPHSIGEDRQHRPSKINGHDGQSKAANTRWRPDSGTTPTKAEDGNETVLSTRKKTSSSISNCSLQMLDEDAFGTAEITDYVEQMKNTSGRKNVVTP